MKSKIRRTSVQSHAKAQPYQGQPVCAVLKDGSYFIGLVEGVKDGELILSGVRGTGRWHSSSDRANRAQVSGFLGSLLGGLGGGASGGSAGNQAVEEGPIGGANAGQGRLGGLGGMLSTIRIGMNMIQAIMPLLSMFKI